MRIVCLGDSLTQGDYGTDTVGVGDVREKNYPYFLEKLTGHDVINYGKCGFRSMECLRFYEKGNEYIMQPNDGVHFGEIGYYTMAKYIGESLGLLETNS